MKKKIIFIIMLIFFTSNSIAMANLWIQPYTEFFKYEGKTKQELLNTSNWLGIPGKSILCRIYSQDSLGVAGETVYYDENEKINMYASFIEFDDEKQVDKMYFYLYQQLYNEFGRLPYEVDKSCIWKHDGIATFLEKDEKTVVVYSIRDN